MTINLTPPNADHIVKFAQESRYEVRFADNLKAVIEGFAIGYSEQQNAELVAENKRMKAELKDAEINFKALADGTIKDEALGLLRAENERLKQQLATIKADIVTRCVCNSLDDYPCTFCDLADKMRPQPPKEAT